MSVLPQSAFSGMVNLLGFAVFYATHINVSEYQEFYTNGRYDLRQCGVVNHRKQAFDKPRSKII